LSLSFSIKVIRLLHTSDMVVFGSEWDKMNVFLTQSGIKRFSSIKISHGLQTNFHLQFLVYKFSGLTSVVLLAQNDW